MSSLAAKSLSSAALSSDSILRIPKHAIRMKRAVERPETKEIPGGAAGPKLGITKWMRGGKYSRKQAEGGRLRSWLATNPSGQAARASSSLLDENSIIQLVPNDSGKPCGV